MSIENPPRVDPREIERPFSAIFFTKLGNTGLNPSAFLINYDIGIEPVDVGGSAIYIRFICDRRRRIMKERALDKINTMEKPRLME